MKKSGQLMGGFVRKAYASKGDDSTLSRFVKTSDYELRKPHQLVMTGFRLKQLMEGRSVFYKRGVKAPGDAPLVSGHNNVKIGRDVRKGKLFRGYWIYTLTLEERNTCPRHCFHWDTCYGNNMPFAKRIDHEDEPALLAAISGQLDQLLSVRGRKGILVRLHALGDFYSIEYCQFWGEMLLKHRNLAIFGYTAWRPEDSIGGMIEGMKKLFGRRFSIRWSGPGKGKDRAIPIFKPSEAPKKSFICPEQTGKTIACATCALCWNTDKNVAFIQH